MAPPRQQRREHHPAAPAEEPAREPRERAADAELSRREHGHPSLAQYVTPPGARTAQASDALKALTVGALIHGGVRLVGADLNGAQTAVVHVLAVVRAARHIALDRVVGSAAAAVVRTILAHRRFLPER